jgi:hypothetical protein
MNANPSFADVLAANGLLLLRPNPHFETILRQNNWHH